MNQPFMKLFIHWLPLPSTIKQLFSGSSIVDSPPQDDPGLHEGRVRSFPHQRGNWSTYVYVPHERGEGFEELLEAMGSCGVDKGLDLKPVADPHISLTRTIVLLHHWIDSFVSSVRTKLCHFQRFTLELGPPAIYCNEERTRTFLGLRVQSGSDCLCELSHALDDCLAEFRLPPFYKDPQFHMSVLWMVGDVRAQLETLLPQLHTEFKLCAEEHPQSLCVDITQCMCRSGNKMFTFPLAS